MRQDPSLQSLTDFLASCYGFSLLPKEALQEVAGHLTLEFHPKGTHLFEENQSRVDGVYLMLDGRGEKTWKNEQLPHLDNPELEKGEVFGAFSILLNDGFARRSLHLLTDCFFYRLPSEEFLKLCSQHPDFKTHFTSHLSAGVHQESLHRRRELPFHDLQGHETAGSMAKGTVVRVKPNESIRQVTLLILEHQTSVALVEGHGPFSWSLVTYRTLCENVILKGTDPDAPIGSIAVQKVHSTSTDTPLFESLLLMARHDIHHLPLVDSSGRVTSILCTRDMPQMKGGGVLTLMANIGTTRIPKDLAQYRLQLGSLAQEMHQSGFSPNMISQFIARINDAIVARVVELALEKESLPCPFAFLVFGSEGRNEQTLVVDQDNGIIFDPGDLDPESLRPAFLEFGRKVCQTLDDIGYPHCKGGVMAREAPCCRSVDEWVEAFRDWIDHPNPESVLKAQIYFDLKPILGEMELTERMMERVRHHVEKKGKSFLHHLAIEVVRHPIPLGFFQNIVLSSKGRHKEMVDLKGIQNLFVDPIRLMAIKEGVPCTNTMERLQLLLNRGRLKPELCDDIQHAYENILHLRLQTQEDSLKKGEEGSNHLRPDNLGELDQRVLKAVLVLAQNMQRKIQRDFDVAYHSL